MKSFTLLSLLWVLPTLTVYAGGDGVGNGGGLGEKQMIRALSQIDSLVKSCLHSGSRCLSASDQIILLKSIDESLSAEPLEFSHLEFKNGDEYPFTINQEHQRSARTGDERGTIYINRDHLYHEGTFGRRPIDFSIAAGLLLDELAHQAGFEGKHEIIDRTAANFANYLERAYQIIERDLPYHDAEDIFQVSYVHRLGEFPQTQVFISNPFAQVEESGFELPAEINLNEEIIRNAESLVAMECGGRPPLLGKRNMYSGFQVRNIHWEQSNLGFPDMRLVGDIGIHCYDGSGPYPRVINSKYKLYIDINTERYAKEEPIRTLYENEVSAYIVACEVNFSLTPVCNRVSN